MNGLRITRAGNGLTLAGDLRLAGIVPALEALRRELARGPVQWLDLAGVEDCDSSAVALMLEMRRLGVAAIRHMPANMQAIVRACQLEALLPIESASETLRPHL